jgi:hypothetical protein
LGETMVSWSIKKMIKIVALCGLRGIIRWYFASCH